MTTTIAGYYCEKCWYVYDPAQGDPEHGIKPGTVFEDIPQQWRCPDCGLSKEAFVLRSDGPHSGPNATSRKAETLNRYTTH